MLPLADEHGYGEACLAGWNAQTHPRPRLQLVVVDPGEDEALERRLRPLLLPHDRWLPVRSSNEAVLYDTGARAAEADVLLLTEAHCVPLPGAAAAVHALFADATITGTETGSLVINVRENPVINRIILEGNKRLKDDKINPEIKLSPRQIFSLPSALPA